MLSNCSPFGNFYTKSFDDIFPTLEDFKTSFNGTPFTGAVTDASLTLLYAMLFGRYGSSNISYTSVDQFRYALASIIFQYGPAWEKKLEIQKKLRDLTEDDLIRGNIVVNNHAHNPGQQPDTQSLEKLAYIDEQSTANNERGKLEAYAGLTALLEDDVSEEFLRRFQKLFVKIAYPRTNLWYVEDNSEYN